MSELSNALHEIPSSSTEGSGSEPAENLSDLIAHTHAQALKAEAEFPASAPAGQLDFFGFEELPFSDSVNPEFFYASSVHETAFRKMALTIQENISLGLVHGGSGTGKTLMTQILLTHLDPEAYEIALVMVSPGMSKTSLLKEILREVLEEADSLPAQTQGLLDLLHAKIIDLYTRDRKLVILIDEAHFLSAEALHILRTISNLETPQKKLATCILFAEDLFLRRLSHPSYQSLRNRMYMKVALLPMRLDETVQYIKFRLLRAGSKRPLFQDDTYHEIFQASGGICRDINRICHNCLVEAFLGKKETVDRETVRNVIS